MTGNIFVSLCLVTAVALSGAEGKGGLKGEDLTEPLESISDAITKGAESGEAMKKKYEDDVKEKPKSLLDEKELEEAAVRNMLSIKEPGKRSLTIKTGQGFDGQSNFQPAGLEIQQTNEASSADMKNKEDSSEKEETPLTYAYPKGLGPVLFNGCFMNASSGDNLNNPCLSLKQILTRKGACSESLDAANFIGVGFDGRGRYSSESRKKSLIQRRCQNGQYFLDQQMPDIMNAFGIYDSRVRTRTFTSTEDYMSYVRKRAGVANSKSMFKSEAESVSSMTSFGGDLGAIGAGVGAGVGAYFGGPAGAGAGAQLGAAVGGLAGGGTATSTGSGSKESSGSS